MHKIIIVEDDPMISEIYQKKFSESGFEVMAADSGEQVLAMVKKKEKVDLILLDLLMPKMSGFEVIKSIKGGQYDPDIKIIVFSNLSQKEDRDKAIKLGADGFIAKSDFTPSALVEEVKRQMNQLAEEVKNEKREKIGSENGSGGKSLARVLLVEDEEIFVEMFGDKLKQDGFSVDFAVDGQDGLKKALTGDYDIFIIDIMLPGINGEELVVKIKQDESKKNIPIIIFSASVDDDMKGKMEQMGVNAFYIKTQLVPSELSKKVSDILGIIN